MLCVPKTTQTNSTEAQEVFALGFASDGVSSGTGRGKVLLARGVLHMFCESAHPVLS